MSRWLTVVDDERGTLKIEFYRGQPFLHTTFKQPMAAMRVARDYLRAVRAWLKRMGHYEVFAAVKEGNAQLYRFAERFGFVEYKRVNGYILVFQRC